MLVQKYLFLAALYAYKASYAYSQINRSNCRRAGTFNPENENQLMLYKKNDHQFRIVNSIRVPSLLSCSGKCTLTDVCRSFNFKKVGTGMNCHILDFDKNNASVELQSGIGWYHYEPVPQVFMHFLQFFASQKSSCAMHTFIEKLYRETIFCCFARHLTFNAKIFSLEFRNCYDHLSKSTPIQTTFLFNTYCMVIKSFLMT